MDIQFKFIIPGIAFLLTLVFGLWLSLSGKPYNGILFNVHKLIALGAVILTVIQLNGVLKSMDIQGLIIILIIIAGLCVVALFASGAFMSIGNQNDAVMLTIHRIAFAVGFIVMALTIYFLNGKAL